MVPPHHEVLVEKEVGAVLFRVSQLALKANILECFLEVMATFWILLDVLEISLERTAT